MKTNNWQRQINAFKGLLKRSSPIKFSPRKGLMLLSHLLMMLSTLLILTSCSTKHSVVSSTGEIWVPNDVRKPPHKVIKKPFYDCDSNLHLCITYQDLKTHLENIKHLSEAHEQCIGIINIHNEEIQKMQVSNPWEMDCKPFDFSCKQMFYERTRQ